MWELYTYEISTSTRDGQWTRTVLSDGAFSRPPSAIARGLLEQWINDNQGRLPGGRVFVYDRPGASDPDDLVGSVRVRVWKGTSDGQTDRPVATAYLGHTVRRPQGRRLLRRVPSPRRDELGTDAADGSLAVRDFDALDDDGTSRLRRLRTRGRRGRGRRPAAA